jgi:hypothetical protein
MISQLITAAQLPGYYRFVKALGRPEFSQRRRLSEIISALGNCESISHYRLRQDMSYEEFAKAVPLTTYSDWEPLILEQIQTGTQKICVGTQRYQPTSGSTAAHKWIPYTKAFMKEMDSAVQAWLGDLGFRQSKALRGAQYWSLSWLPQEQRSNRPSNDDLELLPGWKRKILQKMMAVPASVTFADTMEESQFATLAYLCSRQDLTLVSVWSPTFWLSLLDRLTEWQPLLEETLASGKWAFPKFNSKIQAPKNTYAANILNALTGESLLKKLWPALAQISCWDSAGSEIWTKKVRTKHPGILVQGKGLWATEGVITIPFKDKFPAAVTSHFLEWIDLESQKVLPTWALRKGQRVQPVLTGGHGLLRYKLNDSMEVTGFMDQTPTLEFRGRLRETDLVGEKMSPQLTIEAFNMVEKKLDAQLMSLFAVRTLNTQPYYMVLARENGTDSQKIGDAVEESLSRIFHYKLARELGQLGSVRVRVERDPELVYQEIFERKGMLSGDIKIEPLVEISEEFLQPSSH